MTQQGKGRWIVGGVAGLIIVSLVAVVWAEYEQRRESNWRADIRWDETVQSMYRFQGYSDALAESLSDEEGFTIQDGALGSSLGKGIESVVSSVLYVDSKDLSRWAGYVVVIKRTPQSNGEDLIEIRGWGGGSSGRPSKFIDKHRLKYQLEFDDEDAWNTFEDRGEWRRVWDRAVGR